jgi:hypothetical protein
MTSLSRLATFAILLHLASCGGSDPTLTITGESTIAQNDCTAYTVTRSEDVETDIIIQPSLESGMGVLFADSACTNIAALNVGMAANTNTAMFYFESSTAGTTVIKVFAVTNDQETATFTVTVQ